MMKKPDQIVDMQLQLIYPPNEAILPQLYTIKTVASSTMKMYEATQDIHSIFPNLDMIQRAIDYLRGAPIPEDLKPLPEDLLKPVYHPASSGLNIISTLNRNGEYDVSIVGVDIEPKIEHTELFGELDEKVMEMGIEIPVICGKNYLITQENPILSHYIEDENVSEIEDGIYVKEKIYAMDEDTFQYAFLLKEGRTKVRIAFYADYEEPIVFNITSHIHFGEEVIPPKPELFGVTLTAKGCSITTKKENGNFFYTVEGRNLDPSIKPNEELFGDLPFNALELKLHLPIECFKTYTITQINPSLKHFSDDPNVQETPDGNNYFKQKEYTLTKDDSIDYSFIIENGRTEVKIYLEDKENNYVWSFIISAHIHFKEQE